jgi:uncharacterized protein
MTDTVKRYPAPAQDMDNRPMLEAWQGGRLLLPVCTGCGRTFFYPRPLCPHCWSDALDWRQASGRGTIASFSLVHRPNDPVFFEDAPIILAEVRLDEDVSMLARIIDDDVNAVRSGMTVELLPLPEAQRYPLPTFRLRSPGSNRTPSRSAVT